MLARKFFLVEKKNFYSCEKCFYNWEKIFFIKLSQRSAYVCKKFAFYKSVPKICLCSWENFFYKSVPKSSLYLWKRFFIKVSQRATIDYIKIFSCSYWYNAYVFILVLVFMMGKNLFWWEKIFFMKVSQIAANTFKK